MKKLKLIEIEATGSRKTPAFVDRRCEECDGGKVIGCLHCYHGLVGTMEIVEVAVYPDSDERRYLREKRVELNLGIGDCARYYGITPAQWSQLERGGLKPDDWWDLIDDLVNVEESLR